MITARMTITSMIMKNPRSLLPPAAKPRRAPAPASAPEEEEEEEADDYGFGPMTSTTSAAPAAGFSGQVLNMNTGNKQEVVLFRPGSFNDTSKAADDLRNRKAVIVNMENVDKAMARRVVGFSVRLCIRSGRRCEKDRPVCLPVLPPQYGHCGRSGNVAGRG